MSRRRRETHRELKEKLVKLLGGSCSVCGYSRCLAALEFHHKVPGTKLFTLGGLKLCQMSWEKVLKEAEKCCLLCANCHREHHSAR